MILELDCGNSLIKWRILQSDGLPPVHAGSVASDRELLDALQCVDPAALRWCRIVSVRSEGETRQLLDLLATRYLLSVRQAVPARSCMGVSNGYDDYQRLGLDRWLAVVAGYHLAGKACLVIDLGTAVTADLVDARGQHLGGYICPGLPLMRAQLRTHTRRIRYEDGEVVQVIEDLAPGHNTAQAVERGCLHMLRGFVEEQCRLARDWLGADFEVLLTGGDAGLVADLCPAADVVPDLVFRGLALACPLE
ncbi:type III pantothenate kinase [Pseudomonas oryzae]|uniref:Type III pantothenate kinase n=1 Tax=Pseudomonas oryzae TaxID=1392877 RepID=A0A1H1WXZ8_9PSED|nr:type III pantothenate kinase [Pseudomonas oryzae]SDT02038.1 type III pantothenate kinase [Pseudomonas oryzae]